MRTLLTAARTWVTCTVLIGVFRATTGSSVNRKVSTSVTVSTVVVVLPAASFAVTVSRLAPACSAIPVAVQLVVPRAVPLPPRLLFHVTCVTPTLSDAVPPSASDDVGVLYVEPEVGDAMATAGGVGSQSPSGPAARR